ncbi:OmpA family protein [Tunicatimonas pelagia]|uniref:OmpA family protein n=1 Tax=Tunicatimonas pelagia TaxID=931531 RepID=UPI002665CAE7|nr:OmpA family protein [Tunicatimonas pelagia]WKN43604.1 OmpA family protein [Tunicatimonas pelagia]
MFISLIAHQAVWGQTVYFADPVVLNDTINSGAEESYPMYSLTDSTLYFVRSLHAQNVGGVRSGQDIWYTKQQPSGTWAEPLNNLENLNNQNNNAIVGISQTGNTLYLLNSYQSDTKEQPGMAFSFGIDQGWRPPNDINIPGLEEKIGNFYGIYVAPTEDIAVVSMQKESSKGMEDLYVTEKDLQTGEWGSLIHLGETVNTEGYEISPFLSKDKKTLFFASNGHPGYGNTDIFVSYRQDTSWTNWSKPENLGDGINSSGFDAYLSVAGDGQVFFVSNRYGRSTDIYQSRIISREEREQQLASRIVGGGKGVIPNRSAEEEKLDEETRALLEETQALLNEFKKANNDAGDTYESGNTTEPEQTFEENTVYFNLNSSELLPVAYSDLKESVEVLQENPNLYVEVVGHADDSGGKDYNLKLSIERAQSVKKFLANQGVEERRIITYGKGSTQPVTTNSSPSGRKQNRRVVIGFGQ